MEPELSGILWVELVAKNIDFGSQGTHFMNIRINYLQNYKGFWYCIKVTPHFFKFCTNEINQANIGSKYLSKSNLLNLINE